MSFTDDVIDRLASSWKHLELLRLPHGLRLSVKSLRSLARHCPHLRDLNLPVWVEFPQLRDEPDSIIFPCIKRLFLEKITSKRLDSHQGVASMLDEVIFVLETRFPAVESFWFGVQYDQFYNRMFAERLRHYFGASRRDVNHQKECLPLVPDLLAQRLIEPVPGSRFNPLSRSGEVGD